jgi:hypothetical protein
VARLEALETPAPDPTLRQRLLALTPLAGLTLVAAFGLLACTVLARHSLLHLLGDCPLGLHADA